MKKTIYSLAVNNYAPELIKITKPYLKKWARKIRADLVYITERKFPKMPPNYEKFQIFELGKKNDWSIFIDADCLVGTDMFDPTEFVRKDYVVFNQTDMANHRFRYDRCFRRHGQNIGAATWFVMVSKWTIDAWRPFHLQNDIDFKKALKNIYPVQIEQNFGTTREHIIDDYLVSRNIAKYGLKVKTLINDICPAIKSPPLLNHLFLKSNETKAKMLKQIIKEWKKPI